METTSNWEWFVDTVALLVEEAHLVHARKAKSITSAPIKTDKVDAPVLTHSLELIAGLSEKIGALDDYLDSYPWRPSEMVAQLRTIPGFGPRLSMHAALEIVDIGRYL